MRDNMVVNMIQRGMARGEIRPMDLTIAPRLLIAPHDHDDDVEAFV